MNPNGDPARKLQLTLQADSVAAPTHSAARMCREVIDLYFDTLAKADLSQPPQAPQDAFFRFSITGPDISADERRRSSRLETPTHHPHAEPDPPATIRSFSF